MEAFRLDVRYALRALRRTPFFTAVAIVSLTVGIGVNTAAFSALNAILFRDYPGVVAQDRLGKMLVGVADQNGRFGRYASRAEYEFFRARTREFGLLAASGRLPVAARMAGAPERVIGEAVSGNFFQMLGTRAALGRFFRPDEEGVAGSSVVVVSHAYWLRVLAGRPEAIGTSMTIGTQAFTIVGVAPEGFFGTQPGEILDPSQGAPDVFFPLGAAERLRPAAPSGEEDGWLRIVGRLRPGATYRSAEADANVIAAQLGAADPAHHRGAFATVRDLRLSPRDGALLGGAMVMIVPFLVLFVTCANLANQLLARALERSREIAVRLALGASRGRLVRQLLIESALLAGAGAGGGVVLSLWLTGILRAGALEFPLPIALDMRVLTFTVLLAAITALLFGLLPAVRATRPNLAATLRSGSGEATVGRSKLRSMLVVAQVATSLALLTLTSLFVRGSRHAEGARVVSATAHRLTVPLDLDLLRLDATAGRAMQRAVMERLRAVPGVTAVGMTPFGALESAPEARIGLADGLPLSRQWLDVGAVEGEWFEAVGLRVTRGRAFDRGEMAGAARVSIVDAMAAERLWPGRDPLGQTLRIGTGDTALVTTVIGVVPERRVQLDQPAEGMAFIPSGGRYHPSVFFYVRGSGDAAALAPAIRRAVAALDPRLPPAEVRTFDADLARQTAPARLLASGLGVFGGIAIVIASLGLYAVLAFLVAQRRREIGVRMALGARSRDVARLVIGEAARLAMAGIAVGALLAAAVAFAARALLFGLAPLDPVAFGGTALLFAGVMCLASLAPARRAAAVDPMVALRSE